MATKLNYTIDQGEDFTIELTINEDGSAKDLTGYSFRGWLKKSYKSPNSGKTSFSVTETDLSNGRIDLDLTNTQTSALDAPHRYVWDLEMTSPAGKITRVLQGIVEVTPEVTTYESSSSSSGA